MIVLMNEWFIGIMLFAVGAACGSFAGAQVWRLRARQLVAEKAAGNKVDAKELERLKPLAEKKLWSDRSIDLDTGKELKWYDLIPIVSWLMLRGKSRYSGKPIGMFEFIIELGMALFFLFSFLLWPVPLNSFFEVAKFILWLIAGVLLGVQVATDYKWSILWSLVGYGIIFVGSLSSVLTLIESYNFTASLYSILGSVAILGGLYFLLFAVSRERWVGFGDVILGIGLGLLLGDWMLALVALFLANLFGAITVLWGMATKKIKRGQHVPFGPFFIAGAVVAKFYGAAIASWYFSTFVM